MRIYLAGPLGFSEAGRLFQGTISNLLAGLGHEVVDPFTLTDQTRIDTVAAMPYGPARREAWRALNQIIAANNRDAIDRADAVLAVLDGVDIDSGTAAEIGYAYARGKRILGYRGDFRLSADNDGAMVNLQVEYFIRDSGGDIVPDLGVVPAALARLHSTG